MLEKDQILPMMMDSLKETMDEEGVSATTEITSESPLLAGAVVSSIGLVSVVTDIEMRLFEDFDLEVTLVSEEALSRSKSPFQNLAALADYIIELAAVTGNINAQPDLA